MNCDTQLRETCGVTTHSSQISMKSSWKKQEFQNVHDVSREDEKEGDDEKPKVEYVSYDKEEGEDGEKEEEN